jgi:hypothetical protein
VIAATLVTDGSSDRVLLPILRWLCGQATSRPIDVRWAETRNLPNPPKTLTERARVASSLHPAAQLLFVHRDSEREEPDQRYAEIKAAITGATLWVGVVPVRMQEAWLLHDERALREAAGCPAGRQSLDLPELSRVEALPNPKFVLHEALQKASGTRGRRAQSFNPGRAAHRLADGIKDWSALRALPAFRRLESDTREAIEALEPRVFDGD